MAAAASVSRHVVQKKLRRLPKKPARAAKFPYAADFGECFRYFISHAWGQENPR
jgi:hypothetical protein